MATMGLVSFESDQEALAVVIDVLVEAGEDDAAKVVRSSSLHWWTEPKQEMALLFDLIHAQWYPDYYATLVVPAGTYDALADKHDVLGDAVAKALGTHAYAPLRGSRSARKSK